MPRIRILDLGCGPKKTEGAFGVDKTAFEGVDLAHDLNRRPWPIPDDGFDRVIAGHIVEHIEDVPGFFEEIHRDLGLAFRYSWSACDEFGWVRGCTLENRGSQPLRIELLDGLRNLLPFGASLGLYQQSSNLVDAYKKSELDPDTRLGIFSLTAGITDRAEALESLRANTVCCVGLEDFEAHLSLDAVAAFRRGEELPSDGTLNGARGNYLVSSVLELEPESEVRWRLMADAGLDQLRVTALRRRLIELRRRHPILLIDTYWTADGEAFCPAVMGLGNHIGPHGSLEVCPPLSLAVERIREIPGDLAEHIDHSEFLRAFREFVRPRTKGCVILEYPRELTAFLREAGARDYSGRDAFAEIEALTPRASHHLPGREIPDDMGMYRFLKNRAFFGMGALG